MLACDDVVNLMRKGRVGGMRLKRACVEGSQDHARPSTKVAGLRRWERRLRREDARMTSRLDQAGSGGPRHGSSIQLTLARRVSVPARGSPGDLPGEAAQRDGLLTVASSLGKQESAGW